MQHHHRYLSIYRHRGHLLATIGIAALPFLFLFLVSRLTSIEVAAFAKGLGHSSMRLAIAYAVSLVFAIAFGFLAAEKKFNAVALPLFDVLQSFPTFAILPLLTLTFGVSDAAIIFFLVLTLIWPMLFSIVSSLKLVRQDYEEAAHIFGARGWKRIRYVLLPLSYPGIITGSIIGIGEGWEAIIGAEIVMTARKGLGPFFNKAGTQGILVAFGVTALLFFIFVINKLIWLPMLERSHKLLAE